MVNMVMLANDDAALSGSANPGDHIKPGHQVWAMFY